MGLVQTPLKDPHDFNDHRVWWGIASDVCGRERERTILRFSYSSVSGSMSLSFPSIMAASSSTEGSL